MKTTFKKYINKLKNRDNSLRFQRPIFKSLSNRIEVIKNLYNKFLQPKFRFPLIEICQKIKLLSERKKIKKIKDIRANLRREKLINLNNYQIQNVLNKKTVKVNLKVVKMKGTQLTLLFIQSK